MLITIWKKRCQLKMTFFKQLPLNSLLCEHFRLNRVLHLSTNSVQWMVHTPVVSAELILKPLDAAASSHLIHDLSKHDNRKMIFKITLCLLRTTSHSVDIGSDLRSEQWQEKSNCYQSRSMYRTSWLYTGYQLHSLTPTQVKGVVRYMKWGENLDELFQGVYLTTAEYWQRFNSDTL